MSKAEKIGPIKTVAIVYRPNTVPAFQLAKEIAVWLKNKKVQTFTHPDQELIDGTEKLKDIEDAKKLDLVIALGGDGTYLQAVRMLRGKQKPILGINMGSLGFLTENRVENVFTMLEKTLKAQVTLKPRSMIYTELITKGGLKAKHLALNEVTFERGDLSHLVTFAIYSDDQFVCEFMSDGLVVSTPTGSTAYNLAAGGPLLDPEAKVFVVTPIAAHSLTIRPMVFPDNKRITIKVKCRESKAQVVVDGQKLNSIGNDDEVIIERSNDDHFVIREDKDNFYQILRDKLHFGQRS
jgi:NAD+ kinase